MKKTISLLWVGLWITPSLVLAGKEGMPSMPLIQPKKSYTVESAAQGEALLDQRGYGDQEPMVRMMNLMMVGGSGLEGMEMDIASSSTPSSHAGHSAHAAPTQTTDPKISAAIVSDSPKVGTNILEITTDPGDTQPPTLEVFMTNMDMGTETPAAKKTGAGKYRAKISFSMKGPWAVRVKSPKGETKTFNFDVSR